MKKKKRWFYRSLFSYLPIFLIVISVLFVIFITVLSENAKDSTLKANEAISVQIAQSVDNMLKTIDKVAINHIMTDGAVANFYNSNGVYSIYSANQILNSIISGLPEVESIYLVRFSDDLVLSNNKFLDLQSFADRNFIESRRNSEEIMYWSGKRNYTNPLHPYAKEVVTLARKVPLTGISKGLFVVNIRVAAISDMVSHMSNSNVNRIDLKDRRGEVIYSNAKSGADTLKGSDKYLSHSTLSYTGWSIESGINKEFSTGLFSDFPLLWAVLGLFTIVAGSLLIIHVTLINYKPIESIIGRINEKILPANSELLGKSGLDEMHYISLAIERLLQNENEYESKQKENQAIIRKHLFVELLEGVQYFHMNECQRDLNRIGINWSFRFLSLLVLEIDKYADFCSNYSAKDQYLMKFVLLNVVQEMADSQGINSWAEYVDSSRLGIMVFVNTCEHSGQAEDLILSVCTNALSWANKNLNFTFTIGFGGVTNQAEAIPRLYKNVTETLQYKSVLGRSRVITRKDLPEQSRSDIFHYVQMARSTARSYRFGEANWEQSYLDLMEMLKKHLLGMEDIKKVLQYLLSYLDREMNELPESLQDRWKESASHELHYFLAHFELLEEFKENAMLVLQSTYHLVLSQRECSQNHDLVQDVKRYIESNFSNPDLSLNQLSNEFKLSNRYLSKLFKDSFGEKFIDYLVKLRVERAKQLLLDTNEPVQNVAVKVGYLHPFSFIRVFKKIAGTTPGDFRR
ncbi:Helix-turn-helix domain-containing protein [Paenibacillus sp. UNC496MF]|nr:Helix-turn-helix domain-containing protein [Paenibacillus sp. UNC496MF]